MNTETLQVLLQKLKDKRITSDELTLLRLYISQPDGEKALEQFDYTIISNSVPLNYSKQALYNKIIQHLPTTPQRAKVISLAIRRIAAAAIIIGFTISAWYWWQPTHTITPEPLAPNLNFTTRNAEIRKIQLPDGSEVILNANSTLQYTPGEYNTNRQLRLLEGEAFFDVKKDPAHPFTVIADQLKIQVLGTSFNVKAWKETDIAVAVKTGKVKVYDSATATMLLQGQSIHYTSGHPIVAAIDTSAISNWRTGKIALQKANFHQLAAAIKQVYGTQLIPGSKSVENNNYNLHISYSSPLKETIEIISAIGNNKYKLLNDSSIVIY